MTSLRVSHTSLPSISRMLTPAIEGFDLLAHVVDVFGGQPRSGGQRKDLRGNALADRQSLRGHTHVSSMQTLAVDRHGIDEVGFNAVAGQEFRQAITPRGTDREVQVAVECP